MIDHVKDLPPGIEAMKHDLFSPQPVKDAKAHYFRTVLHDWPDKQVRQRLTNIKTARNKDKDSVLLINEDVSPETKVPLYPTMLDLSMMALFSSPVRTQSHFQELLNFAGFKIAQILDSKTCGVWIWNTLRSDPPGMTVLTCTGFPVTLLHLQMNLAQCSFAEDMMMILAASPSEQCPYCVSVKLFARRSIRKHYHQIPKHAPSPCNKEPLI